MFDSIVNEAQAKFNSGGKSGMVLSGLLRLMANPATGGFHGFIEKFHRTGLGDAADSWIRTGDNQPISSERLENTLGTGALDSIAEQAGVDRTTTATLLGFMMPRVVDALTPNGEMPDEADLLSKMTGYLGNIGGAAAAGTATIRRTMNKTDDVFSGDTGSGAALKYILPLLLLALLGGIGYWFFQSNRSAQSNVADTANPAVNTDTTIAKTIESNFKIEAKDGKYTVSGIVPDAATLDKIKVALTAQFGAGNVDFAGLKVEPNAKPFVAGWWDNFGKMLPNLKDWKTGSLAFTGGAITSAIGLPSAALDQLKSLFAGWTLPVSVAGAETAAKQANEEALKELSGAVSIDQIISALNVSIINFKSGSSVIPADAKALLEKASEVLKKQPDGATVEIGGYTDNQGSAEANKKLSQNRADAVKKALVGLGVKDAVLKSAGYGDADPIGDNNSEDGRFKNRRIEYKKADGSAPIAAATTTSELGAN